MAVPKRKSNKTKKRATSKRTRPTTAASSKGSQKPVLIFENKIQNTHKKRRKRRKRRKRHSSSKL